jgi:hypothetical protein
MFAGIRIEWIFLIIGTDRTPFVSFLDSNLKHSGTGFTGLDRMLSYEPIPG